MTATAPITAYLRWLRDDCGISVHQIAASSGVPWSTVQKLLKAGAPRSMLVVNARKILALQPQGVAP
ncbi:hypothetical protein [Nocardia sp. NPDC057227]|uniref:hypothetical protein n=1 Tax=Nocardia sp. NPDC057227 TaxID=3346056 RepID=UPI00362AAFFA